MKQDSTPERVAGFLQDGDFWITHIFSSHDKYQQSLGKSQQKDFSSTDFMECRKEEFDITHQKLKKENEELQGKLKELKQNISKIQEGDDEFRKKSEFSKNLSEEVLRENRLYLDKNLELESKLKTRNLQLLDQDLQIDKLRDA